MKVSRNRLGNVGNSYQGQFRRVLCVCAGGVLRSPTLAEILSRDPFNFNTRSVGINQDYALTPVDLVHVAWADYIVVMDSGQEQYIKALQLELYQMNRGMFDTVECPVYNFRVEDDYEFRDPHLVRILIEKSHEFFKLGD